jgi:predicted transcriptional regulator
VRELFLEYAKRGAMTKEQVAEILKIKPEMVRRYASMGVLPRIPGLRLVRFDPMALIDVLCKPKVLEQPRSLTIERHKTGAKSKGGYRSCL